MDIEEERDFPKTHALMTRILNAYVSTTRAMFWRRLANAIEQRNLPLFHCVEMSDIAMDKEDLDTVQVILASLDRKNVQHPLIEEIAARRLIKMGQFTAAMKRLDDAILRWKKPYLMALRMELEGGEQR